MAIAEHRTISVNAAGRSVPNEVNGRSTIPYQGVNKHVREGNHFAPKIRSSCSFPSDGNKVVASLKEALQSAGIRDGMTVSTHHHLRNGDLVALHLFQAISELGVADITWMPSAAFPCHAELIPFLVRGTIRKIEGSLNGALGHYASDGKMNGLAVLRSHGGRYRAIQDGDIQIDIAVIAAPSSDKFGNANGVHGPSACGGLGFAFADAQYAEHSIVVTDNLVEFPNLPIQIYGNWIDQVVVVDSIGDASQIVSGTTAITRSPERLLIAKNAAEFVKKTGIMRDGFSFQAGAGGISLAFTVFMRDAMIENQVRASFIRGGSNKYVVEMLEAGLCEAILDGQTFDLDGVRSMRENPNHVMTTPMTSYNFHGKGNFASMVDCVVLGATEVDLDFNANVVTHSDGLLLHGLGGWQDALYAKCTMLTLPTFRNRIPMIRDRVTTLCGPGELVDVVVTERGIAVNPRREDLLEASHRAGLELTSLTSLKESAEALCGGPPNSASLSTDMIGVVEWVDGSLIDSIARIESGANPLQVEVDIGS